ncbi:MAG TPA: dihydrofolate reductase family protein [Anaerolineales bacterium]|nr:dihydrofolate reductase family protein [Anaerolineales bacterium]
MRKLTVNTFLTLDGVMQAPGGPGEDPRGGFSHEGWSVGYWDDVMNDAMNDYMGKPFAMLLGRKTYEIFAGAWPQSKEPGAKEINEAKKYVASKTLKQVSWQNSELLAGDVAEEIRKLKTLDGPEIQVHGSSNLLQTLLKNDLIDEYNMKIFPVTIGKGKRLFGDGAMPAGFKLVDSKISTTGVIAAKYVRDGEIKKGSFGS